MEPMYAGERVSRKAAAVGEHEVLPMLFGKESTDGQVVAEDADAALGRNGAFGNRGRRHGAAADVCEHVELDRALERLRELERAEGLHDEARIGIG